VANSSCFFMWSKVAREPRPTKRNSGIVPDTSRGLPACNLADQDVRWTGQAGCLSYCDLLLRHVQSQVREQVGTRNQSQEFVVLHHDSDAAAIKYIHKVLDRRFWRECFEL